jgi:precorrin-6B methylase 2
VSRIRQRMKGMPRNLAEVNRSLQYLGSLRSLGWHESLRSKTPLDAAGGPLPWYTYPCIEWLATRLRPTDSVFEFGAGSSTLWYSQRTTRVIAVEHDQAWFERLVVETPRNAEVQLRNAHQDEVGELRTKSDLSEYVSSINVYPPNSFDIVVVDGMERLTCIGVAVSRLKEDGLLILDNSDRPVFHPAIEQLARDGLGRIDFHGFPPGAGIPGCTSVFARFFERWLSPASVIRTWGL